ncbi:hypothetical protein BT96DRAFT_227194 [Gymnopus androsaceus JB14]|uniref:Uncharacterized protein n=1 Tax=Gymnopus androsaceus JB14 TaxID=1447944 RepID=A0A6A4H6G9_9AGAR|nr:hypothetical protein BT96DRAFT_227194 [Gymnopus androsaceus JB14]
MHCILATCQIAILCLDILPRRAGPTGIVMAIKSGLLIAVWKLPLDEDLEKLLALLVNASPYGSVQKVLNELSLDLRLTKYHLRILMPKSGGSSKK